MTINKEQAQARLSAIEDGLRTLNDEAAALRSIIEAPEKVEKKPLVQAADEPGYPILLGCRPTGFAAGNEVRGLQGFETRTQAQAYAEAFNTLLDLRRQPGSEAAEDGKPQWVIWSDGSVSVFHSNWQNKTSYISPMFDTEASALAAREAVGLDRILRMYNTLHGRGYE